MNHHVANFREALVFANELNIDTTAMQRDAEQIVAAFLAAHGAEVAAYDADDLGEGSATFALALAMTFDPSEQRWLQLYADQLNEDRAQRALAARGYACANHPEHVVVGGQEFDGFAAAANAMSISY